MKWTDHLGHSWPELDPAYPLKFAMPAAAALRAFVFWRDGFQCQRCLVKAVNVPDAYSGRYALHVDACLEDGYPVTLIVDHRLTRKAGGRHHPDNLQALCETCNKRKQREDKAAALFVEVQ